MTTIKKNGGSSLHLPLNRETTMSTKHLTFIRDRVWHLHEFEAFAFHAQPHHEFAVWVMLKQGLSCEARNP
jgi:hypothetical protein